MNKKLSSLAKDLNQEYPRSPHETLGGFVVAARMLDKCRAVIAGTNGEYKFDCPLDNYLLSFTGVNSSDFKNYVSGGADDNEVASWIREQVDFSEEIIKLWNLKMRQTRIMDLPTHLQLFLESYIQNVIPGNRRIYTWFDVYDIEEKVI